MCNLIAFILIRKNPKKDESFWRSTKDIFWNNVLYRLENKVELITFEINENSAAIDIPLKDLKIKKGTLVASILRNGKMIFPGGNDMIKSNDSVMIVSTIPSIEDFDDILERV